MGLPSARLSSDLPESSTSALPETGLPLHLNLIQRHGNRNVHWPPQHLLLNIFSKRLLKFMRTAKPYQTPKRTILLKYFSKIFY